MAWTQTPYIFWKTYDSTNSNCFIFKIQSTLSSDKTQTQPMHKYFYKYNILHSSKQRRKPDDNNNRGSQLRHRKSSPSPTQQGKSPVVFWIRSWIDYTPMLQYHRLNPLSGRRHYPLDTGGSVLYTFHHHPGNTPMGLRKGELGGRLLTSYTQIHGPHINFNSPQTTTYSGSSWPCLVWAKHLVDDAEKLYSVKTGSVVGPEVVAVDNGAAGCMYSQRAEAIIVWTLGLSF